MAGECEFSKLYHVWPQYTYVELIDDNNLLVNEKDRTGSIIGTSFNNLSTPLIRYKSGDTATYGGIQCNLCGRHNMILEQIGGREQNYLVLANGKKFSLSPFQLTINKINAFKKIRIFQLIQDSIGDLLIKLDTTHDFDSKDEAELKTKLLSAVKNQLTLTIEYTNDFIKTESGKNILFIQRIRKDVD